MMRWMDYRALVWVLMIATFTTPTYAQKSGVSPTVLVLPKGPGSLSGIGENVSANLNMGLMSYPIKIKLPKGRSGFTPKVNVVYSSSAGAGMMGIGWTLQAHKSIQRLTVRGLPTYTNEDSFYADGELVKVPKTPFYRARIEGGFVRYRWYQQSPRDQKGYWVAEYPDGAKAYFGATTAGKVVADAQVSGTRGTYRWELQTKVDARGNRIEYRYVRFGHRLYISTISWVLGKAGTPLYKVAFSYEERPDPISDGKPGFDLETNKRLKALKVTSAGQQIRAYEFTFDASSGLSRLIKVVQYGTDPKKPYPIQHTIKYSDATYSEKTARMVKMPTPVSQQFKSGNADFIDVNGDGLPDIVNTANSTHKFYLNTLTLNDKGSQDKHDFPADQIVDNPVSLSAKLSNPSVQLLDANGDGFTDMVDAVNMKIYLNKGNQKWEDNSEVLKSFPNGFGKDPNLRFMDYNGDKKIDVIRSTRDNTTYWINDGKGSWNQQKSDPIGASFSQDKLRLIDINGDGLQDAVQIISGKMRYKKYYGYGKWSDWITIDVPGLEQRNLGNKPQFRDINGDGLADMVAFIGSSIVYFVNKNGRQFAAGKELQKFAGIDIPDSDKSVIRIADMNGNGSRDIVWISQNGKITYLELFRERPNLLKQISNGIGQRINVDYNSSVYHYLYDKSCDKDTDKACVGPWKNKMPMPFTVVQRITTWASRADTPGKQASPTPEERPQIQRIYYHHGFYDGKEKKFRGFRHVETIYEGDPAMSSRKDELRFDVGDTDTYMHGKMLESRVSDGVGKTFQVVRQEWGDCLLALGRGVDGKKLQPPVRFICLRAKERQLIEGRPNEVQILRREYGYDGYGNQTMDANLGVQDKSGDERVVYKTFIQPSSAGDPAAKWFLRFVRQALFCSSKERKGCAEEQSFYDGKPFEGLPAGQIERGKLTRVRVRLYAGKDEFVDTVRRSFDRYGNTVGHKDAKGALRTFVWDQEYQRFPQVETIHLKGRTLVMKTQWDPKFNVVVQSTDVNGQNTFYSYDAFGRLVAQLQPGDAPDKPSLRYRYVLQAPLSQIITDTRSRASGDFDQQKIQCFDGLGRKLSTLLRADGQKYLVMGHKEFTREGQVAARWDDYYQKGSACQFLASGSLQKTQRFYDGMRRLVRVIHYDAAERRRVYTPLKRTIYDEEDNHKDSPHFDTPTVRLYDGLSRLVEEQTMPGKGKRLVKKFRYTNTFVGGGYKVLSVTFPDGTKKRHEYDLRGLIRKTIDPDRSTTLYTYTATGKVASRTDARGVKLVYTYDALDRMLTRQEVGKDETQVRYTYDVASKAFAGATFLKGRRASITYPHGQHLMSYNARGQMIHKRHIVGGRAFAFKLVYDNVGRLLSREYPNGTKVSYQLDLMGRVLSIGGVIKSITRDTQARLTSWTLENGVTTRLDYDKRNRLTGIDIGNARVLRFAYKLDRNGNYLSWEQRHGEDSFANLYTYDSMYRLTLAELVDGKETLRFQQDDLSNITAKTSSLQGKSIAHVGAYDYDETRIHAVTRAGSTRLKYGKAGHMDVCGPLVFSWDHLGRKVKSTKSGVVVQRAWYEHDMRRVAKEEKGHHVFYIDDLYEIRQGASVSYIKLRHNRLVAIWSPKGVAAFFDDLTKDGKISAGDAWLYHAHRAKVLKGKELTPRTFDVDLTKDMMQAGLYRMLHGEKERRRYYHVDHIGSIRAVTDENGAVVQRKHFYPYGALRTASRHLADGLFTHGYQGTELDVSTQTNAFLVRSLDPRLGRWLSPDPAFQEIKSSADEFNSYGMVLNNPIRMRDIHGTESNDTSTEQWAILGPITALGVGTLIFAGVMAFKFHLSLKAAEHRYQERMSAQKAGIPRGSQSKGGPARSASLNDIALGAGAGSPKNTSLSRSKSVGSMNLNGVGVPNPTSIAGGGTGGLVGIGKGANRGSALPKFKAPTNTNKKNAQVKKKPG